MQRFPRYNEYKVLAYRIFLAYLFYMGVRFLFFAYNPNLIRIESWTELVPLAYHGLAFDTTAILYANALFIVFSILPFGVNTRKSYQLGLKILYFSTNALFYALNFVDLVYYRYSFNRSTRASLDILEHESNKAALMG
ncbi:MAG: LTA synthase family protein, partial [Flavobacterium sp.]